MATPRPLGWGSWAPPGTELPRCAPWRGALLPARVPGRGTALPCSPGWRGWMSMGGLWQPALLPPATAGPAHGLGTPHPTGSDPSALRGETRGRKSSGCSQRRGSERGAVRGVRQAQHRGTDGGPTGPGAAGQGPGAFPQGSPSSMANKRTCSPQQPQSSPALTQKAALEWSGSSLAIQARSPRAGPSPRGLCAPHSAGAHPLGTRGVRTILSWTVGDAG